MQQLQELANERALEEKRVAENLTGELTAAEEDYQTTASQLTEQFAQRRRDLENEFGQTKQRAGDLYRQANEQLRKNFERQHTKSEAVFKQSALAIERNKKESEWQALAVFDAAKDGPQQMLDQAGSRFLATRQQVDGLERDAHTLLGMRRLVPPSATESDESNVENPAQQAATAEAGQQINLNQLHQAVLTLQAQRLPSLLLEGIRPWGWWLATCVATAVALGWLVSWSLWLTPLLGMVAGSAAAGLFYFVVGGKAKQQSLGQFACVRTLVDQARNLEHTAQEEAREKSRQEAERITQQKINDLLAAQATRDRAVEKNEARKQEETEMAQARFDLGLMGAQQEHDEAQIDAEEKFPPLLVQLAEQRQAELQQNEQRYQQRQTQAQQTHDADWQAMAERWQTGFQAVADELAAMRAACEQLFPDWSQTEWHDWQRPTEPPAAIQFGSCRLPLSAVKNGVSEDPRLRPEQTKLVLPALMTIDELPRLIISASGQGRTAAVNVLQAMMFRFLTAMPAGKLRFTILDPSALGENFAAFMHLADYDEQLVGGRIWTESRQIDEQLGLLCDHMERVLQKYLRNEFATLHEYNQQAGEVAEPYRVLVMANFPAGLNDASIRKLQTIATTGPRCGVYTMLGIDTSIRLPNEFDLSSLYTDAVHLQWVKDRLQWNYPLYEKLPLSLDRLPPRDRLNDLLRIAGEASREASRVEVPFSVVAPPEDQLWSGSTAHELVVPVGRAGANDLQSLRLGRGTAQHVLISGKTGSGKSTLLHALITNLALHYSPNEVEFYLVDFKKGVEFKAYATGQLPHARVIAIESEREFGVSVLERLDEELRRRGERFRDLGVQDLAGLRAACDDRMPRILLVIDEFQELFVTDDKLSQDAALLLDRLVRQGRAFGIHVLLGSQTLAGSYSLARSTIGQMAVRISLECSEADAHLILSDENSAARLLSRPGEAIYNDQNGLVDGNNPFQVVWLPDAQRQQYLAQIREKLSTGDYPVEPAIVFEGNVPADPRDNEALVELIRKTDSSEVSEPTIWLGSAVRIEPPTGLTLRRQSGNHLLVVGQDEPQALGILATAVAAIAAQQRNATEPRVLVLDGTRPESTEQGAWSDLAAALPGQLTVSGLRDAAEVIASLSAEVARRGESSEAIHTPRFLVIHDLAQFRNLRMSEDEFSFSSATKTNGQPTPVDKQFRNLLREGAAVGVHVLMWCDSYNSLNRFVDRLTLRELDYRVALQMSSSDSTSLIDSPAASRIGEHRAIFYRDDLGTQVKFRPYGLPSADWLAFVGKQHTSEKISLR